MHPPQVGPRFGCAARQVNGGATLMTLLLAGARFGDGILPEHPARHQQKVPMAA